ncbi:hypothetical protein [Streptomyces sp. Midd1]|uniref:hypothetical protein n=1 Tax=Streptomyces sp. Midd3 TaxID=3161191 RepID=UPI0034DAE71B
MLGTAPLQSRFLDHADHYARWSGLAIGVIAAQALSTLGQVEFEQRVVFCITAFGLCAVAGVLLADALTLVPQDAVRTASLAPRLVRKHVPPRMGPLIVLQGVSLTVLLVITAITASIDSGRTFSAGKVVAVTCNGMRALLGPWPGLYYSLPMFGALAIATPTCMWALRRIADGPGGKQQRCDRAWAVTGAWGLLVFEPAAVRRRDGLHFADGDRLRRRDGTAHLLGVLPAGPREPVHRRVVPGHRGGPASRRGQRGRRVPRR